MDKRRWGAVWLFGVAFNATCGGPKGDSGGQTGAGAGQAAVSAAGEAQTETRRSALVEPNIAPPAPLATEPFGRLPGGGGVSLDGNYTYSVPIDVPPGRAGMQPSLSLAYSSRGANGALGMGWRIAGLSSIARCTKTTSAGGWRAGIEFVATDEYCLDGIRLAKVSGNQGEANSVYRTETDIGAKIVVTRANSHGPQEWTVYFKSGRIATYSKPSADVWTSRFFYDAAGAISPIPAPAVVDLTWPIVKETDRTNNKIDYKYTMSHAAGSSFPLPYRIEYTKCDAQSCAYPDAQIRRVEFVYTLLVQSADYLTSYTAGVFQSLNKQLSDVVVSVQSGTSTTYNAVRKYKVRYLRSPLTKRYLLKGIKLCDRLDVCIPETTFNWTAEDGITHRIRGGEIAGAANYQTRLVNMSTNLIPERENFATDSGIVAFDADGDGNDDLLAKDWVNLNAQGAVDPKSSPMALPFDLLFLGDGAGYFDESRAVDLDGDGVSPATSPCTEGEIMDPAAAKPVDLDGDGSMELLAVINVACPLVGITNFKNTRWLPHMGGMWQPAASFPRRGVLAWDTTKRTLTRRALPLLDGSDVMWSKVELVDLNGDGIPELMAANASDLSGALPNAPPMLTTSGSWHVWDAFATPLATVGLPQVGYGNQKATALQNYPAPITGRYRRPSDMITDEDGDGRFELMQLANDGTMRAYGWSGPMGSLLRSRHTLRNVVNSTTSTWVGPASNPAGGVTVTWGIPSDADPSPGSSLWRFADVNGDGLKDAYYRKMVNGNAVWEVRPNTGNGYGIPRLLGSSAAANTAIDRYPGDAHVDDVGTRKGIDNGLRVADINGDGREDLVLLRPETGGALHWSGYLYTTEPIRVMYSNGVNFDAPVALPSHGKQRLWREQTCTGNCPDAQMMFPMTAIGDFDGNGISDIAEFVDSGDGSMRRALKVYALNLPGGPDKIVAVRDLMVSNAQTISYDSMSSGSFRRKGLQETSPDTHVSDIGQTLAAVQCKYPARCMTRGLSVVSSFADLRQPRTVRNTYSYVGGRADAMGKGWLGFRFTRTLDDITGRLTTRTFDNRPWPSTFASFQYRHFPRAFIPLQTAISEPGTGTAHSSVLSDAVGMRSRSVITWTPTHVTGGPIGEEIVRLEKSATVEQVVDMPPNVPTREYQTVTDYDGYGNPTLTSTKQQDFVGPDRTTYTKQDVTTAYTNDEASWLIGLPNTVTDTASTTRDVYATGCTSGICKSSTRVTTYEHSPSTGLLAKVHRNPGSSDAALKGDTIYERDSAGLVKKVRRLAAERALWIAAPSCTSNAQCEVGESCLNEGGASLCRRVREETIQYDATGSVAEGVTNAVGHVSWRLADPATGLLYATVDANGFDRVMKRDGLGRPREVTGKDGSKVTTGYGILPSSFTPGMVFGLIERHAVLDGQAGVSVFDQAGRLQARTWSTFDNQTGVARFSYDPLGNTTEVRYATVAKPHAEATDTSLASTLGAAINGTLLQSAQYDAAGRPVSTTKGTSTSYFNYLTSMAVGETDSTGRYRLVTRDAGGRIKEVSEYIDTADAVLLKTSYSYDERGNLARLAPPGGAPQLFDYDILGRKKKWRIKDVTVGSRYAAEYDSFDDVSTGAGLTYKRDALGRVVSRSGGGVSDEYTWDQGVGALGHLSSARSLRSSHETINTYDGMGRLTQRRERFKEGESLSVGYGYDNRGRLGSIRYPEASGSGDVAGTGARPGPTVAYLYKNGQLESLREASNNNAILWQATQRHPMGMIGGATTSSGVSTTWAYYADTLRPFTQTSSGLTSGPAVDQTFKYYPNGMLSERTTSGVKETFEYDGTHRLGRYRREGSVVDATFRYNGAGHMTTVDMAASTSSDWPLADETMTYGAAETLNTDFLGSLTVGTGTRRFYNHDAGEGRLFEEKEESGSTIVVKKTYYWTALDLPDVIRDTSPSREVKFLYDAGGTRIRKTSSAGDDVAYIGQLYERRNLPSYSTKESVYRLIADGGVVGELAHSWNSNSRTSRFFIKDHQGSIAYEVTGTVAKPLGFFPFGRRKGQAPAQAFSSLGYTGHSHDDDLGLINMRGRIYHVAQHRFLSRDPLLGSPFRSGGANPHSYVRNNPVNFTDPSGFEVVEMPPAIVICCGSPRGETPQEAATRTQEQGQSDANAAGQAQAQATSGQAQAAAMSGSQPITAGGGPGAGHGGDPAPELAGALAGAVEARAGVEGLSIAREYKNGIVKWRDITGQVEGPQKRMGQTALELLESGAADLGFAEKFAYVDKLGKAAGAFGALTEVADLVDAVNKGDGVETAISTFKLTSEFMGRFAGPLGSAFDTGMAIGDVIAPALDFGWGSTIYKTLGGAIVEGLGLPVDRGATR